MGFAPSAAALKVCVLLSSAGSVSLAPAESAATMGQGTHTLGGPRGEVPSGDSEGRRPLLLNALVGTQAPTAQAYWAPGSRGT